MPSESAFSFRLQLKKNQGLIQFGSCAPSSILLATPPALARVAENKSNLFKFCRGSLRRIGRQSTGPGCLISLTFFPLSVVLSLSPQQAVHRVHPEGSSGSPGETEAGLSDWHRPQRSLHSSRSENTHFTAPRRSWRSHVSHRSCSPLGGSRWAQSKGQCQVGVEIPRVF